MFHTYNGIRYWKVDSLSKGTLECVYKDSYIAWEADRGVKRWARSWCHTLWGLQGFQAYTGTPLSSAPRRINCTSTSTAVWWWLSRELVRLESETTSDAEMRQIQLMVLPWMRLRLKPPKSSLRIISSPTPHHPVRCEKCINKITQHYCCCSKVRGTEGCLSDKKTGLLCSCSEPVQLTMKSKKLKSVKWYFLKIGISLVKL